MSSDLKTVTDATCPGLPVPYITMLLSTCQKKAAKPDPEGLLTIVMFIDDVLNLHMSICQVNVLLWAHSFTFESVVCNVLQ